MAVPDYQSVMLPLLKIGGDGSEHSMHEVIETLALQFGLSKSDRDELLPSGIQRKFDNRVSWAYLSAKSASFIKHRAVKVSHH